ncbi:MAG: CRISPR-associated endonuclease Cas2 [Parcubacteria group bacterium]|nr:CRISPR-associated endonuclease Cas2 [Parcubacteria group bacterium]
MGTLEKAVIKKERRDKITEVILKTIAAAGILSIALIAPNALQIFKIFKNGRRGENQKYYFKTAASRLAKQGLLEFKKTEHGTFARLTPAGENKLRLLKLGNFEIQKPKRWDGRWRVVIFDIKERRRKTRDKLRLSLIRLGFVKLQDSVWVFPYDCEDFVSLLKADFMIGKDILYLIVEKLENDKTIRKHFNLS